MGWPIGNIQVATTIVYGFVRESDAKAEAPKIGLGR